MEYSKAIEDYKEGSELAKNFLIGHILRLHNHKINFHEAKLLVKQKYG